MARAFVALGSNQGELERNISAAVAALIATPGVQVTQMASIYRTAPVGGPPQPEFANTVVELDTLLAPSELLAALQRVEHQLGRRPAERWGPRVIDLDVLLYDDLQSADPSLTIPHPRMADRRFVLEPLAQLAPDVVLPGLGVTVAERLSQLVSEPAP